MKSIKVFAPATVANVACGFDIMGFAVDNPGDEVVLQLADEPGVRITRITGDEGRLPLHPDKNTASVSIMALLQHLGSEQGFELELHKRMPLGSGLGSSAASAAAGVFAANQLLGAPLTPLELLPFAMEGERQACGSAHADNVAPALLGGFVIIRSYDPLDVFKIPTPEKLFCTIVHPDIEVNTKDARHILKNQITLKKAVVQWGNVAGLVAGLLQSDYDLIGRSLQDVIIEPIRGLLIPGFTEVKVAAAKAGALGSSISGSGPSIFALSPDHQTAVAVGEAITRVFQEIGISGKTYVSKINQSGPMVVEKEKLTANS
jgi:homoserine kinase